AFEPWQDKIFPICWMGSQRTPESGHTEARIPAALDDPWCHDRRSGRARTGVGASAFLLALDVPAIAPHAGGECNVSTSRPVRLSAGFAERRSRLIVCPLISPENILGRGGPICPLGSCQSACQSKSDR